MFRKSALLAAAALFTVALAPPGAAQAGEKHRVGNAAMGAAAGLVVGGPIGAIAGAAVGYTAGEDIAHGMGIHRHRPHRHHHRSRRRPRHDRHH